MNRRSVQALIAFSTCMAVSGVLHAESFLVENLNDSGVGTLRAAIVSANANPGPDTIDFDAGLNGTIVLASALPNLTEDVVISGPGAEVITVSGNSLLQPFFIAGDSTVTLSGLTIADGQSGIGGGVGNEGDLTITHCVLTNNHAETDGGAIDNFGGSLVVNQSTLTGNTMGESGVGAGISNTGAGTVSIIESTFTGNTAGFSGGAIYNEDTITIVRSTLSSNSAGFYGGAVENTGTLTIRNSTLSENVAGELGGGIDNLGGEVSVEFSTLTENAASSGGGIGNDGGSVKNKNTLVVKSTAGGNCVNFGGGTFTALGVNFATDASCPEFTQATAGEVNLGPLADNGGPTQTHALLATSVAIDAALDCTLSDSATPVTQDQRGQARPAGPECDSGAFEGSASVPDTIFLDGFEGE